jgi:hypothetical protein
VGHRLRCRVKIIHMSKACEETREVEQGSCLASLHKHDDAHRRRGLDVAI